MIKKILLGLSMIIPTIVKAPPIANQTILKPFYILPNKSGESIKLKFEFTCNINTTLQGLIRITNPNQTSMIIGSINLSLSPTKITTYTLTVPSQKLRSGSNYFTMTYKNQHETFNNYLYFGVMEKEEQNFCFEAGGNNIFNAGSITYYDGSEISLVEEIVNFSSYKSEQDHQTDLRYDFNNLTFYYQNDIANVLYFSGATISFYNVAHLFPHIKPNLDGSITFSLYLVKNDNEISIRLIQKVFLNKTTNHISKSLVPGYIATEKIYFPKHGLELNNLYEAKLKIYRFGYLRQNYEYSFNYYAKKRYLGVNGEYEIEINIGGLNA